MRAANARPFRLIATDGYNVIEFGSRYSRVRPDDRELILSIFHRTIGGRVGVVISPEQIPVLGRWFAGEEVVHHEGGHPPLGRQPDGSFQEPTIYYREFTVTARNRRAGTPPGWTLRDLQQTVMCISAMSGGCILRASWNGSGTGRSATLSPEDRRAVAGFLTRFERDGWATTGVVFNGTGP